MKKILFITNNPFPSNSASATRLYFFCKIYYELGYEITVFSTGGSWDNVEWIDRSKIKVIFFAKTIDGWKANVKNLLTSGYKLNKELEKIEDVNIVFMYGIKARYFYVVNKFCKNKGAKLIADCCEWFSKSQFPFWVISPFFWEQKIGYKYLYKKLDGIISISKFFIEFSNNNNIKTIRIPTILDTKFNKLNKNLPKIEEYKSNKINLVYSGFIGKNKDSLSTFIEAFIDLKELHDDYHFHIVGPTSVEIASQLKININELDNLKNIITIYGRMSREKALNYVTQADYSILLRKQTINSKAGFPTKIAESMVQGIPIICNLTSDLNLYVKDKISGIVLLSDSKEDIKEGLKKIQNISMNNYEKMSKQCLKIAEKNFDYREYIEKIKKFNKNLYIK